VQQLSALIELAEVHVAEAQVVEEIEVFKTKYGVR
jgi:hypothetical protein